MKKFTFRLQRILEIRESREKQCQTKLAQSLLELNREKQNLRQSAENVRRSLEKYKNALSISSKAGDLLAWNNWFVHQGKEMITQTNLTEAWAEEADKKRRELIAAAQEKKVLEHLHERRLEEYQAECRHEEQEFMDELGGRISQSKSRALKK